MGKEYERACVERMVPGREDADGQGTLGEATDLRSLLVGTATVGGTSGVKGGRAGVPEALPCRDRAL